jgi:superfamily II DNA or RNA helicase
MIKLQYSSGTLWLVSPTLKLKQLCAVYVKPETFSKDLHYPLWPWAYLMIKRLLATHQVEYVDECLSVFERQLFKNPSLSLRDYQTQALNAWREAQGRGLIVLPTGSGKTRVALAAIQKTQLKTLVCVPTLELLKQWRDEAQSWFDQPIGCLGGGEQNMLPLTIATYQSASKHQNLQNYFGFHIYDEVHHLPSESFSFIAKQSLAPYRLGVTATLQKDDERFDDLQVYCGPLCFEKKIDDLSGRSLAPFQHHIWDARLSDLESKIYWFHRKKFLKIMSRVPRKSQWKDFVRAASKLPGGKESLVSHRLQKKVSFLAEEKFSFIEKILNKHAHQKILIFTNENESAYRLGERFLLPVLTYRTSKKERSLFLESFRQGEISVLVASRVLNEGVDVPDAEIAVIFSGNSSERELIQRLGRVLRKHHNKEAILYELVAENTSETMVSYKRQKGLFSS